LTFLKATRTTDSMVFGSSLTDQRGREAEREREREKETEKEGEKEREKERGECRV